MMNNVNPFAGIIAGLSAGKRDAALRAKDDLARVLSLDPEKLARFEEFYKIHVLAEEPESDDVFHVNSRQAAERNHAVDASAPEIKYNPDAVENLIRRVVDELLAQTSVYVYNGRIDGTNSPDALATRAPAVTLDDVLAIPDAMRPQLTGELMRRDVAGNSGRSLLELYAASRDPRKNESARRRAYETFRQGLDIIDLDALTYAMIDTNPASMGHWLPALVDACRDQEFFKIPRTRVAKVPLTLLQLTRLEYQSMTPTTLRIVDEWARQAFDLVESETYFVKTGTYSSKFDFRNARVAGAKEVRELGEYLLYIHFQALQMASPLATPTIYGASTTTEWVVREFVEDKENNPTIYKGLPLHTEYRVFVDCDEDVVLGCAPYWEPETMRRRFGHEPDANSPHQIHDYVTYRAHEHVLMNRYNNNKPDVVANIERILPGLNLTGQWSIDVMQNGEDFWLIDMAPAEQSAFYADCVPAALRRPARENWLPEIPDVPNEPESEVTES